MVFRFHQSTRGLSYFLILFYLEISVGKIDVERRPID